LIYLTYIKLKEPSTHT